MAVASISLFTCDRCGTKRQISRADQGYAWAKIHAHHINGPLSIGSRPSKAIVHADLCPPCANELSSWWLNPSDPEDSNHVDG